MNGSGYVKDAWKNLGALAAWLVIAMSCVAWLLKLDHRVTANMISVAAMAKEQEKTSDEHEEGLHKVAKQRLDEVDRRLTNLEYKDRRGQ